MNTIASQGNPSTIPTPPPTEPEMGDEAGAVLVIPKGGARATCAGAMLDLYRAVYALEGILGALGRGCAETAEPLETALTHARHALEQLECVALAAAKRLDAGTSVTP